jgi:hypothetical protein
MTLEPVTLDQFFGDQMDQFSMINFDVKLSKWISFR